MNNIARIYTDSFIADFKTAQKVFKWDGDSSAATFAAVYIGNEEPTDESAITSARQAVKNNSGLFSGVRSGYARNIVLAAVALADDKDKAIKDIMAIEAALKPGLLESYQWVICASLIYLYDSNPDHSAVIQRTRQIYNELSNKHPIIGSGKHVANCALLAMSDKDPIALANDYEANYRELTKTYGQGSDTLYAAAAMSLFGGDIELKAEKVRSLHQQLKKRGFHFTAEGLEIIALIAGYFGDEPLSIIDEMIEVSGVLVKVRGLGAWGVGDKVRNMLAATIVLDSYTNDKAAAYFAKQAILNVICEQLSDADTTTAVMITTM